MIRLTSIPHIFTGRSTYIIHYYYCIVFHKYLIGISMNLSSRLNPAGPALLDMSIMAVKAHIYTLPIYTYTTSFPFFMQWSNALTLFDPHLS